MRNDAAAALERVMERLHIAVISGDLGALPALAAEAEAGIAAMPGTDDVAAVRRIQALAARNAACLAAAARGVRAARRRLTEIAAAKAGLQTYDDTGATQRIGVVGGAMTQRF